MTPLRRIADRLLDGGRRQVIFEAEWREGFVGRALTIEVDGDFAIQSMEFYDADLGITKWAVGRGMGVTRLWEEEPSTASHQRHFQVTLLASGQRRGYRPKHVEELEDQRWIEVVRAALRRPQQATVVPDEIRGRALPTDEATPPPGGIVGLWRRWVS